MKNIKVYFIAVASLLCLRCTKSQEKERVCTAVYVTIGINFLDKHGKPVILQNFSAVNTRTNQSIKYAGMVDVLHNLGYYAIATDSDLQEISVNGDNILVTANNSATSQTKSVVVAVSKDFCHIIKVSGPDQVIFD